MGEREEAYSRLEAAGDGASQVLAKERQGWRPHSQDVGETSVVLCGDADYFEQQASTG